MTLSDNPIRASYLYLLRARDSLSGGRRRASDPHRRAGPRGSRCWCGGLYRPPVGRHLGRPRPSCIAAARGWRARRSRATNRASRRKKSIASRFSEIDQHCKAAFGRPFAQLSSDAAIAPARAVGEGRDRVAVAVIEILLRSAVAQHRGGVLRGSAVRRQPRQSGLEAARVPRTAQRRIPPPGHQQRAVPRRTRQSCSTSRPARCRSTRKAFRST